MPNRNLELQALKEESTKKRIELELAPIIKAAVVSTPRIRGGRDGYTPIKGIDYFDGAPGYTPVKDVDYFDGRNGDNGLPGYSPIKDVDYFDGLPGLKGDKGDPGDNANITKTSIEGVLIGEITSHTHPGGSGGLSQAQIRRRIC